MHYEVIIGLEIHIQQKTKSKMFCGCDNNGEGKKPNSAICPVCAGLPGTLPVPNKKAIENVILLGLALNCQIPKKFNFERKNYFYPDSPKGYQITSSTNPPAIGGYLDIPFGAPIADNVKRFKIHHIHLEEDAGKLLHPQGKHYSLVDLNRAGTPLIELVTEADFHTPGDAKVFLQELRLIARYLGVSDADMEKGHLRCDANISLRPQGDNKLYAKTEIKNLNSFKSVERALEYEIKRQAELWDKKNPPAKAETRGWNDARQITTEQRGKEEAHDYRYFPEPDIPPIAIQKEWLEDIKTKKRELPIAKRIRFMDQFSMSYDDAKIIAENRNLAYFTENAISELIAWLEASPNTKGSSEKIWEKNKVKISRLAAGWIINKLQAILEEHKINIREIQITPENFGELIHLIYENRISSSAAQKILAIMFKTNTSPITIMEKERLAQVSNEDELESIADEVIKNNPKVAKDYKGGKVAVIQFLIGQVMKKTKGKANPLMVKEIMEKKLS